MQVILILLLLTLWGVVNAQATLSVSSATYPTIQSALNAGATGDMVVVAAGVYQENLVWPATELGLIGAGIGQSIIDGTNSGSCIVFNTSVSSSYVDGFTLTNGIGTLANNGAGPVRMGGAVHILPTSALPSTVPSPTFRNCRFTNNSAEHGGAIFVRFSGVTLEDCLFDNNSLTAVWGRGAAVHFQPQPWHIVTLQYCIFRSHVQGIVIEWDWLFGSSSLNVSNCLFGQNIGFGILRASVGILNCIGNQFVQNSCSGALFEVSQSVANAAPFKIESCSFSGNTASQMISTVAGMSFGIGLLFTNNTVVDNTTTFPPFLMGGATLVADCIIADNVKPNGVPYGYPIRFPNNVPNLGFSAEFSNIQGGNVSGPGVVTVPSQFVDQVNGDYRLAPGSPLIDAGTVNPIFTRAATDVRGFPRVRNGIVDVGAYEAQSLAHHPASAGRVGETAGGPYDVLTMNGSKGDVLRKIEVPIGSSVSLEMAQPAHLSGPLNFSIFGILGEANFDSVISVPLGIGDMMFAPAPMIPFLHPSFFTMASTVGQLGLYAPLFVATPTPWVSGPGPSIPIPLLLTLQGVIEESPGVFVPTNALVFEVK